MSAMEMRKETVLYEFAVELGELIVLCIHSC